MDLLKEVMLNMKVSELYEELGKLIAAGKGEYIVKYDNDKGVWEVTEINVYEKDKSIQIDV